VVRQIQGRRLARRPQPFAQHVHAGRLPLLDIDMYGTLLSLIFAGMVAILFAVFRLSSQVDRVAAKLNGLLIRT
jgi:hypothetical protein